jgi:hypothetical protein
VPDPNDFVGFYISISEYDGSNYNTTTNKDGLISAFILTRWRGAQLTHQKTMRSTKIESITMKLNARHVRGIGARTWFGILVYKGKSTT